VIDEPLPWKAELARVADRLERRTRQSRWTARTGHLIERDFVSGAHAVRKLIEAGQVPADVSDRGFPVRRYARTGAPPHDMDDVADRYDFANGRRRMLTVSELCREIVDSFVFAFCCGETADLFDGVYVSADRLRQRYVHLVLASDFIALCGDVSAA
jgi:hypothetical protein